MSRRRYISTDISTDTRVNRLAEQSDFAALLYTWMIPHADDAGTLPGDPEELMFTVIPGRRSREVFEVVAALEAMVDLRLIEWDREGGRIAFPAESFYRYQTYVKAEHRRAPKNSAAPSAPGPERTDTGEQRKSAENSANSRLVKPSVPIKPPIPVNAPTVRTADAAPPEKPAQPALNVTPIRPPKEQPTPEGYELLDDICAATSSTLKGDARRREGIHADELLRRCGGDAAEAVAYVRFRMARGDSPSLQWAARDYASGWRQKAEKARASPGIAGNAVRHEEQQAMLLRIARGGAS